MNEKSKKLVHFLMDDMEKLCNYAEILEDTYDENERQKIVANLLDEVRERWFYWDIHMKEINV